MKYSNASIRERGDGRWQARFYFKDGDRWKEVSRSFKATSRRAAKKRADEIKEELERAAAAEGSEGLAKLPEEDMTVGGFLRRFVDNLENSGQIERTTAAGTRVCLHDLRHTYATFLIARGVDVKTVSSLMGHADATVTLNVYASVDPRARKQAAEVVAVAMAERAC